MLSLINKKNQTLLTVHACLVNDRKQKQILNSLSNKLLTMIIKRVTIGKLIDSMEQINKSKAIKIMQMKTTIMRQQSI